MMPKFDGDHLVAERPTPNTPEEQRRAARFAATYARDAVDLTTLLDMLGIDPAEAIEEDNAA